MSPQQSEHQASRPVQSDCMTCEHRLPAAHNSHPLEFDKCAKWYQFPMNPYKISYCTMLNKQMNCDLYILALNPALMQRIWRWLCLR